MTDFSNLNDDELEHLVSLPYKAGIWVSHADDEDGELDDEKEQKALDAALHSIVKDEKYAGFVQNIFEQTLAEKTRWSEWGYACFSAPKQADQVSKLIQMHYSADDLRLYTSAVMHVSTAVAQAYGEFSHFDETAEAKTGISAFVSNVMNKFSTLDEKDEGHPMNISASEDSALKTLKTALKGAA